MQVQGKDVAEVVDKADAMWHTHGRRGWRANQSRSMEAADNGHRLFVIPSIPVVRSISEGHRTVVVGRRPDLPELLMRMCVSDKLGPCCCWCLIILSLRVHLPLCLILLPPSPWSLSSALWKCLPPSLPRLCLNRHYIRLIDIGLIICLLSLWALPRHFQFIVAHILSHRIDTTPASKRRLKV